MQGKKNKVLEERNKRWKGIRKVGQKKKIYKRIE